MDCTLRILICIRIKVVSTSYILTTHVLLHLAVFFFFNDTATPDISTLSLHDALPISAHAVAPLGPPTVGARARDRLRRRSERSEEHTSELQSRSDLVCRLLLEKKKIL